MSPSRRQAVNFLKCALILVQSKLSILREVDKNERTYSLTLRVALNKSYPNFFSLGVQLRFKEQNRTMTIRIHLKRLDSKLKQFTQTNYIQSVTAYK